MTFLDSVERAASGAWAPLRESDNNDEYQDNVAELSVMLGFIFGQSGALYGTPDAFCGRHEKLCVAVKSALLAEAKQTVDRKD